MYQPHITKHRAIAASDNHKRISSNTSSFKESQQDLPVTKISLTRISKKYKRISGKFSKYLAHIDTKTSCKKICTRA